MLWDAVIGDHEVIRGEFENHLACFGRYQDRNRHQRRAHRQGSLCRLVLLRAHILPPGERTERCRCKRTSYLSFILKRTSAAAPKAAAGETASSAAETSSTKTGTAGTRARRRDEDLVHVSRHAAHGTRKENRIEPAHIRPRPYVPLRTDPSRSPQTPAPSDAPRPGPSHTAETFRT